MKQRKSFVFSSLKRLSFSRKADIPGWALIVALIIGILGLIFLIWLAIRSGKAGVDVIDMIP